MKKSLSMLAIAAAGLVVEQNANAVIAPSSVAVATQISVGCTVPTGANGSTVYSIDAQAFNGVLTAAGVSGLDTISLPSGVSVGATCDYAINQLIAATGITSVVSGKWVNAGATAGATVATGATPTNITIPGTGYSLQQYTFVAQ